MKQRLCLCFSTSHFDLDTKMLKCPLNQQPPEAAVVFRREELKESFGVSLRYLFRDLLNGIPAVYPFQHKGFELLDALPRPLQMVPNRFLSHDGPIVASAENPGVQHFHPIDRFLSLIESIPIIGSKEVGRGIKTCPIRAEKNAFFFQK